MFLLSMLVDFLSWDGAETAEPNSPGAKATPQPGATHLEVALTFLQASRQ